MNDEITSLMENQTWDDGTRRYKARLTIIEQVCPV